MACEKEVKASGRGGGIGEKTEGSMSLSEKEKKER